MRLNTLIGLDNGSQLGWAVLQNGTLIEHGVLNLTPRKWQKNKVKYADHPGKRYRDFVLFVLALIDKHPQAIIAYEEVKAPHKGTAAAAVYHGQTTALLSLGYQHEVALMAVPVGTIKKVATGKGNARKDAMIEAMRQATGIKASEHEADAYWCAVTAASGGGRLVR